MNLRGAVPQNLDRKTIFHFFLMLQERLFYSHIITPNIYPGALTHSPVSGTSTGHPVYARFARMWRSCDAHSVWTKLRPVDSFCRGAETHQLDRNTMRISLQWVEKLLSLNDMLSVQFCPLCVHRNGVRKPPLSLQDMLLLLLTASCAVIGEWVHNFTEEMRPQATGFKCLTCHFSTFLLTVFIRIRQLCQLCN